MSPPLAALTTACTGLGVVRHELFGEHGDAVARALGLSRRVTGLPHSSLFMCLWRKRVQAIAKETLGIGWRRHSELGPNLLMDNEANFAIFS
jgi:hypothetical protein